LRRLVLTNLINTLVAGPR